MNENKWDDSHKLNYNKIDLNDISTWKYFPIGELKRKLYDNEFISLDIYLERYYKDFDKRKQWDEKWIRAIILPLYNKDIEEFKKLFPNIEEDWFYRNRMKDYFELFKIDSGFEDDILMFIAYMKCYGFFEDIKLSYNEWIRSKNYNQGGRHQIKKDKYSLREIAQYKYGMNLIRDKLMGLEWHKR